MKTLEMIAERAEFALTQSVDEQNMRKQLKNILAIANEELRAGELPLKEN